MGRFVRGLVVVAGLVALVAAGCGGSSSAKRHLTAKLKVSGTYSSSNAGKLSQMRAVDVVKAQLKGRAALRAQKSPAWAKQLAKKFTRMGQMRGATDRLRQVSKATGRHPLDIVFDSDVAVFAYDDYSGDWLDAQYVSPDDGSYDLEVPDDSPVSLWFGTYDDATADGTIIAPETFGWDYELAPDVTDVDYDYDPYLWVDPESYPVTDTYAAADASQEGYYQLDWTGDDGSTGTAWFYLQADMANYGSYYLTWDDGTCANGTQIYISFDDTGTYFSVNGLDAPVSFSGTADDVDYLGGLGRMTVVGDDGLTYYATISMTYVSDTSGIDVCATDPVIPADPVAYSDGCDYDTGVCCPAGCVPDDWYGICVIDITYDAATGTGASCDLTDVSGIYSDPCPAGCALWDDGFCYVGGDPTLDICI